MKWPITAPLVKKLKHHIKPMKTPDFRILLMFVIPRWSERGGGAGGVVDSYQGVGGGTVGGYYLIVCFFTSLLSFVLSCPFSFI